jgi:uncharacterized protein (DUF2237 family)
MGGAEEKHRALTRAREQEGVSSGCEPLARFCLCARREEERDEAGRAHTA